MNFYELSKDALDDSIAYRNNWFKQKSIRLINTFWYNNDEESIYIPLAFEFSKEDLMADDWELEKKKEKHLLVIEDVEFYEYDLSTIPTSEKFADWLTLVNNPKMKMTLEWEE